MNSVMGFAGGAVALVTAIIYAVLVVNTPVDRKKFKETAKIADGIANGARACISGCWCMWQP